MGLRVLGPLDLVVGNRSLRIGGPKERTVLAALALKANRVTSMDHLVDAVWDSSPPTSARGQIQKCISGLRRLFGDAAQPGEIRTCPPGYLLDIPPGDLDSEEFTGLVAAAREHVLGGRIAQAADTLRAALALWRGPALDGVPSSLVQRGAALLEDARLAAIEERVRLDLAMGRHQEVCGELAALVDEQPLRERLYGFLMLALYRSGRQAEALDVARRARATLIDEVGVEPGPELRDLTTAILNRDPALDLRAEAVGSPPAGPDGSEPAVTPRQLPGSTADFVGRERQIAEIKRLLSDGPGGTVAPHAVRLVAVSGRGGVGKSTLALHVAHELGRSFPDGHLYADLRGEGGTDRSAELLARFLRALGVAGPAVPEDTQERAELYRSLLAGKRLLVLLDGVTSEEQVLPLLPGTATCPVLVTSRARLTGLPGAHWVDVDPFDAEPAIELLARIVGRDRVLAERGAVTELVDLCGGLPLALRIAGGRLASRPRWRIAGLVRRLTDEARRLDELAHRGLELRSSIGLTYRSLSGPARRLFRLFALVPAPDFPGWTAAALLDTDPAEADEALADLVDAHVLDMLEHPGERIRYRFHDLVQIYAHERLVETDTAADRRAALERVLGAWLALAETAHRSEYGGDFTVLRGRAPRWPVGRIDGDPADDPIQWWQAERGALVAAVRAAAAADLDELCWNLALLSVSLFEVKGYFDDWRETALLAHDVTRRLGNRFGQAAALYSLGTLHMYQKRLPDAERCLTEALELFQAEESTHGCALVLRNAASVHRLRGDFPMMLARYDEALTKLRAVGDPIGEAHILRSLAKFWIDEGDTELARSMLEDALSLCEGADYLRGEAQVLNRFAELHLVTGQLALARQDLHRVLLIVRDIGDRIGEAHALYGLGLIRRQEGKLDSAETTMVHALSLARQVGERVIEGQACHVLGGIQLARGNYPAAAAHLVQASTLFGEVGATLWNAKALILLAEVHEGRGDSAAAGRDLDRAAEMLCRVEGREATRLLDQINDARSAPLGGIAGFGADLASG
ncbi:MAG TPA: BTAD domain-containing putative transcriptional regulator [Actinophytocola sp.]|uniref:AfsR/SARP family transcriptional regulator n=1 Tax=Actinophytocola sp. TaxID=1872138 RepID=UPI002DBDF64A|nr:BTAD domain-containing putative transcriptional regulator [Actinophytocola sp.]HEU5473375.1 BTAD domain-containing putative transcriptional regulator [Actinophytocola sp.]